jgi:2',3'-cyclic-nucleotide 2'-phosphodiesterase (5'-nucleotidase family)
MSVTILHYSDVETALDEPEQCGALAGTLDALRDDDTIVLGSGDNTAPGALSLATDGAIALSFFDAVEPAADTFGNHDFDFGHETAAQLAADAPQPWLCANAKIGDERFADDATEPRTLVDAGDTSVGIIGVAHPKTGVMNPAAEAVSFEDPVPLVRRHASALRRAGAEYVVVTSHCGSIDEKIARETDVDAIVGGHIHDVYEGIIDGTAVVRPGRAGRYVSEVVLGDDPQTAIHSVDDGHVDESLTGTLTEALTAHGLNEVATTVDDPIERTEDAATVSGSRLGNLVTDALRWKADADVALSPPGGIRSGDPLSGEITVADIVSLSPYEDDLAVVELSGDQLRDAFIAVPLGYHNDDFPERYSSHVSGAHFVWDDEAGEVVELTVDGSPVDPQEQYRVAVADYLVHTDHVNDAFDEDDVVERCGLARDAIVDFARAVGFSGGFERRVKRPALHES